jgi:hypothetical protein
MKFKRERADRLSFSINQVILKAEFKSRSDCEGPGYLFVFACCMLKGIEVCRSDPFRQVWVVVVEMICNRNVVRLALIADSRSL